MKRLHAPSKLAKVINCRLAAAEKCKSRAAAHRMFLFALERFFAPVFTSVCMLKEIKKLEETFAVENAAFEIARARRDASFATLFNAKLPALEAAERALCEELETPISINMFAAPPTHKGTFLIKF